MIHTTCSQDFRTGILEGPRDSGGTRKKGEARDSHYVTTGYLTMHCPRTKQVRKLAIAAGHLALHSGAEQRVIA